jgi:hypothetical protein
MAPDEPGDARPGRGLTRIWPPIGIVSAHAVGRWFERTGLRDHAMLLRDLAVLVDAGDDGDRVATPEDGSWLGGVEPMRGSDGSIARARSIRTWVGD